MLGLPLETAMIILGVIGFWILYTVVFVWRTRSWGAEDPAGEEGES